MIAPKIAAWIRLPRIIQVIINAIIDGIVIIVAIMVPLNTISRIESLDCLSSDNR